MVRRKKLKKVIELVEGEGRRKTGVIVGTDVHKIFKQKVKLM